MHRHSLIFGCLLSFLAWRLQAGSPPSAEATPTPAQYPSIVPETPLTFPNAPAGAWTIVVLPDTQSYLSGNPEVFDRQIQWLIKNRETQSILFVTHEGDITDNNNGEQWRRVRQGADLLRKAAIPFLLTTGNHDYGPNGRCILRLTALNEYLPPETYSSSEDSGLFEADHLENSWHTFATPLGKFLAVGLEFAPRDSVVTWAGQVIAAHPGHRVVITTHAYLYSDGTRYDWDTKGKAQSHSPRSYPIGLLTGSNDGEDLWEKLISRYPNILLVLSGHATGPGTGYLKSQGLNGNTVHQILANYQIGTTPYRGHGGGGYLRLLRFLPDGKTLQIRTYSPLYDTWLIDPANQFDLAL